MMKKAMFCNPFLILELDFFLGELVEKLLRKVAWPHGREGLGHGGVEVVVPDALDWVLEGVRGPYSCERCHRRGPRREEVFCHTRHMLCLD